MKIRRPTTKQIGELRWNNERTEHKNLCAVTRIHENEKEERDRKPTQQMT